jgi:hypothetical protein
MTLDVRGSLKNTRANSSLYIVFDELLSNAIDTYLIRKNAEPTIENLKIEFDVEVYPRNLDQTEFGYKVSCFDNGAGFADAQVHAFVTKDTTYKDDLTIPGIGKCRGSGRIQFFHHFKKIQIRSIYRSDVGVRLRQLDIDTDVTKLIELSSFSDTSIDQTTKLGTQISLDVLKDEVSQRQFQRKDLRDLFSADNLKQHVMMHFLHRFVGLKESVKDFEIVFNSTHGEIIKSISLTATDLPEISDQKTISINYQSDDGHEILRSEDFLLTHYKLNRTQYNLQKNLIAFCAKASVVLDVTSKYLKTKTLENNAIVGFYHLILVESDILDDQVHENRESFHIPLELSKSDFFAKEQLTFENIYNSIDQQIESWIAPPNWDKELIVKRTTAKFGISPAMISEAKVRVRYGDTEESVVKRVLGEFEKQIIKDTSEIFDLQKEIVATDPTSDGYREKLNDISWKYTSTLKTVDMVHLSQIIVRRAAILEILKLAISKTLSIQSDQNERRQDESVIHNIFFPMGRDSVETKDHDIWLLSEEYAYFNYMTSDMQLSKIKWDESNLLFESDVDDKLKALFAKNIKDNALKRPDIAIFNEEGTLIIIEFKAPGVDLASHTADLMEYAQLLTAKSNGKLKKIYGYLIGTEINANRLSGYTRFPQGKGHFGTFPINEGTSGQPLGSLYAELLHYDDVLNKANKRLEVYKKRLNLNFEQHTTVIHKEAGPQPSLG